jgi:chromosome segregation ATPase
MINNDKEHTQDANASSVKDSLRSNSSELERVARDITGCSIEDGECLGVPTATVDHYTAAKAAIDAHESHLAKENEQLKAALEAESSGREAAWDEYCKEKERRKKAEAEIEELVEALASVKCDMYDSTPLCGEVCEEVEQALAKHRKPNREPVKYTDGTVSRELREE